MATFDGAHQRQRTFVARKNLGKTKARAPFAHGRVEHVVALRLVDGAHHAALVDLRGHTRHVQGHEVRHQPHHRSARTLGKVHIPFNLDEPAQTGWTGVPKQAALQQTAAQPAKVFAHQGFAHRQCQLRKTQFEVTQCDVTSAMRHAPQHRAKAGAHDGLHRQGQPVKEPDQKQQTARREVHSQGPQTGFETGLVRPLVHSIGFELSLVLCPGVRLPHSAALRGCL